MPGYPNYQCFSVCNSGDLKCWGGAAFTSPASGNANAFDVASSAPALDGYTSVVSNLVVTCGIRLGITDTYRLKCWHQLDAKSDYFAGVAGLGNKDDFEFPQ